VPASLPAWPKTKKHANSKESQPLFFLLPSYIFFSISMSDLEVIFIHFLYNLKGTG
jgi:hypothetical protein